MTITKAVNGATSSVLFCVFSPTDQKLLNAILAAGDNNRILTNQLNVFLTPLRNPRKERKSGRPPQSRSRSTPRSRMERGRRRNTTRSRPVYTRLSARRVYDRYTRIQWELRLLLRFTFTTNSSSSMETPTAQRSTLDRRISARARQTQTTQNLLEFKDNTHLAIVCLAEFMRVYNHYRACAIWDQLHPRKQAASPCRRSRGHNDTYPLVLKTKRSDGTMPTRRVLQPT